MARRIIRVFGDADIQREVDTLMNDSSTYFAPVDEIERGYTDDRSIRITLMRYNSQLLVDLYNHLRQLGPVDRVCVWLPHDAMNIAPCMIFETLDGYFPCDSDLIHFALEPFSLEHNVMIPREGIQVWEIEDI